MKIQRYFAIKGLSVLYIDKDKVDSLPESVWEGFKQTLCGEGTIESFPNRIRKPVEKDGWFVDAGYRE